MNYLKIYKKEMIEDLVKQRRKINKKRIDF